jgi:hypothetical protein
VTDEAGIVSVECRQMDNYAAKEIRLFYRWPDIKDEYQRRIYEWLLLRHAEPYDSEAWKDPDFGLRLKAEFEAALASPAAYADKPGYTYSKGCAGAVPLKPPRNL